MESDIKTEWFTGEVTSRNYSYALPDIESKALAAGRIAEWKANENADVPIISDRGIDDGAGGLYSVNTIPSQGVINWRGSVAYNDNHAAFEAAPTLYTTYDGRQNNNDHLFVDETGGYDALMIDD